MAIIREFNLHTNAGPSIPPVIHVNQYDRGETWKFKLYQPNGQQLTPTDAAIVGIKSDGHIIANAGTVSGGVISITETEQMTAAPGKAVFEILFDNDTHGTANFIVLVEPSPTNDGIASESDLSLFQEAIDSISPATINAAVSAWMSAQLTPSEWVIDNSLTVANAAADAKKAGDLIRQNTADIGDLTDLVTEDQSSLVGAINETRTDLYNWFTDDIEKVKYIYEGSGSDADIYEVRRLEWDAANDADITGLKVITRKEGTSTDTSKFFVDGNELMEYVIGDTGDLSGTITEEISDLKSAVEEIEEQIEGGVGGLDLSDLIMTATQSQTSGFSTLTLSDGETTKSVDIPVASLDPTDTTLITNIVEDYLDDLVNGDEVSY